METHKLITQIPDNSKAKDRLFEILEDNDELMLEVFELILNISEKDRDFRSKVLNKIFETNFLSRRLVEETMGNNSGEMGCCKKPGNN